MFNDQDSLNYGYGENEDSIAKAKSASPQGYEYDEPHPHHHNHAYEYPVTTTPIESVFGRQGIVEAKSSDYSKYYQTLSASLTEFAKLILEPNTQGYVTWDGTTLAISSGGQAGTGTVTSVALSAPSTFSVSGSPITGFGTLSFSWNGSSANFILADGSTVPTSTYALASSLSNYATTAALAAYQPLDADLIAISSLGGLGLLRRIGANTWELDTTSYLTPTSNAATASKLLSPVNINGTSFDGSSSISFNSDSVAEGSTNQYFSQSKVLLSPLTGYSLGSNTAILATDTLIAAFGKIQSQINNIQPSNAILQSISGLSQVQTGLIKLTNGVASLDSNVYALTSDLSNYQPLDADLTAIAGLVANSGILRKTAANTWSLDTATYLTGNQSIAISGDASGSGSTSISLTVGKILGITIPAASTGNLKYNGSALIWDATSYLTGNQSITWTSSGDVSGSASGATAITPALVVTGIQGKSITLATGFLKYNGTSWAFDNSSYQPLASNLTTFAALGNPGANGYVLSSTTAGVMSWVPVSGGGGTVTSVGLTAPTIFTVSSSPVTSNGNLSFAWNGSNLNFVLGDGTTVATSTYALASALSSYLTTTNASSTYLTISNASTTYQPLDGDLTSIAGLSGTSGIARKTAANTWTLDTASYLTANQSITWTGSGDISGSASGTTSISPSITVTGIRGKGITLATGLLRYNGTVFSFDNSTFLTANQSITLSGDVTGSGTTAITATISAATVIGKALTGYTVGSNAVLAATDTILAAFGKIQAQITATPGTVTSISLTVPSIFTVSGSPITSNGTLSFAWNGSSANFVRADGSTVATSTYALASALSSYLTTAIAATTYQPLATNLTTLGALGNPASNGYVLSSTTAGVMSWVPVSGGGGTVTSVGLTAPSIFTVSNSPITTNGNISFAWNGSNLNFVLGDGSTVATSTYALASALSSYLTTANASSTYLTITTAGTTYQPLDADLTSIAGLGGTTGWLKKTAANTWALDTSTFLTGNQSITVTASGDVSGSASGTTSISPALTVTGIQGKGITLATGLLRYNGTVFSFDSSTYLTSNQSITLSGDVSGSGTTAITVAVNKILGNTVPANASGALSNNGTGTLSWVNYLTTAPTITLTGVVTGSGTGSFATSFATSPTFTGILTTPNLTLSGFSTGTLINTSGVVSSLSGTNIVLGNGNTIPQSTFVLSSTNHGMESTGIYSWASPCLSIASSTTFNITAVQGQIVDTTTTPGTPIITQINYAGATGVTALYVATAKLTYLYLDNTGTLRQSDTSLTPAQRRSNIFLGELVHATQTALISVDIIPDICTSVMSQTRDLWSAIRFVNNGVVAYPNGANLNINISGGYFTGLGLNWGIDPLNPMKHAVGPYVAASFRYGLQIGGVGASTLLVDPTKYDNAGVLTSVGGGAGSSTNQRIYVGPAGQVILMYGQRVYSTFAAAIAGIANESFIVPDTVTITLQLIGILTVNKTCTQLNNPLSANFMIASKFGEVSSASSGSTTATLQHIYDNSTVPQILTSTAIGALTIKRGTTSDTDNVLVTQNGAGANTFSINGNGAITVGNWNGSLIGITYGGTGLSSLGTIGTAILSYSSASNGFIKWNGSALSIDTSTYLTNNQSITLSGDASGSGTTTITVSVNKILGNTVPVNASGALTNNGTGALSYVPVLPLTGGSLSGKLSIVYTGTGGTDSSINVSSSTYPTLSINNTGAAVDSKKWTLSVLGDTFNISAYNDANGLGINCLTFTRSGMTILSSSIAGTLRLSSLNSINGVVYTSGGTGTLNSLAAPGTSGYLLSSTTAGVLSWVAPGAANVYKTSSAVTVTNTTTTTNILSNSLTSSNQSPGNIVDFDCEGTIRYNNLTNTLTMNILIGVATIATLVLAGTDIDAAVVSTDYHWKFSGRLSPQTGPGVSSNIALYGELKVVGESLATVIDVAVVGTGIDTTTSNNLVVKVAWSAASTNNSITSNYSIVNKL